MILLLPSFFLVVLGRPTNPHVNVMPATNHQPGPAPLQEHNVPRLHPHADNHVFWSDKTVKTLFYRTTHTNSSLIRAREKVNFLKNCLNNNVVPVTLRTHFSNTSSMSFGAQTTVNNITHSASVKLLKVAISETQNCIQACKVNFSEAFSALQLKAKNDKDILEQISFRVSRSANHIIVQCQNQHKQRLEKLCPNYRVHSADSSSKPKNNRHFTPRAKHRRIQQKKANKPLPNLVTNFSSFKIEGTPCEEVLSLGLNFVPARPAPNTTKIAANLQKFQRGVRWAEVNADREKDAESNSPGQQNIFKVTKVNYPKSQPSNHVKRFYENISEDILYSPLNTFYPNLTKDQEQGIETLISKQRTRDITIKPNDKNGGVSVLNTSDYIEACESMLFATYKDLEGSNQTYYRTNVPKEVVFHHWARVKDTVEEGRKAGYISESDAQAMVPPDPKPGRLWFSEEPRGKGGVAYGKFAPTSPSSEWFWLKHRTY